MLWIHPRVPSAGAFDRNAALYGSLSRNGDGHMKVRIPTAWYALILASMATMTGCSSKDTSEPEPVLLSFSRSAQTFDPVSTYQIDLGDLDNDGDLDAVFSNMGENNSAVWLNDGDGYFSDSGQMLTQWGHGVGVGDFDEDGDLDLFVTCASYSHASKVYFNDGEGQFEESEQDVGDTDLSGNGVYPADIDNDGDLDVLVVYYEQPDKVYMNDGHGVFGDYGHTMPEHATLGDLDSDGDVDIFLKDRGTGYRAMLNDGVGNFSDCWQTSDSTVVYGYVSLSDLDGDGDVDAFACNGDNTGSYPTQVFLNDGTGHFESNGQEMRDTVWGRPGLGDLNGDSIVDVFVSNFGLPNEVWVNDGAALFTDTGLRLSGQINDNTTTVSLADLDGDGDLDAFVANFIEGVNEIWFNES